MSEEQSLGLLIRAHRLAAGLTQEELAERAAISARSVSDLERGLNQVPHRDTIARLIGALSLSPEAAEHLEAIVIRQRGPIGGTQGRGRDAVSTVQRDLPIGIVTFLSAEAQGSGRLGQRSLEHLQVALKRQAELIQECVERYHGIPVRAPDEGDTHMTVFRTASEAVAAALDIQHAHYDASWPTDFPLHVRMAVLTGEADVREGEYYGSAVTRCTRLRTMAANGQTLVSQAVNELARPSLPADAGLRDIGEHYLSDVAQPEHIFELTSPWTPRHLPLPPPSPLDAQYDSIVTRLLQGRVVLFAGDAINRYGRPAGASWQGLGGDSPPTTDELAKSLAGRFDYPRTTSYDLPRVAQFAATIAGTGPLFEELHRLLDVDYRPTRLHEFLASLPATLESNGVVRNFPLIVTCSYDDALERAFSSAGVPFDLVSYIAEGELRGRFTHRTPDGPPRLIDKPNKYVGLSFEKRTIILKVNGTTDRTDPDQDSFVVTEDHYLDYLTGGDLSSLVPVTIAANLRRSHFLFLGHDVRNWPFRVILRRLWGEQRLRYKSWAINSTTADAMQRGLWRDRGVDLLDVSLEDYLEGLRSRLQTQHSTRRST